MRNKDRAPGRHASSIFGSPETSFSVSQASQDRNRDRFDFRSDYECDSQNAFLSWHCGAVAVRTFDRCGRGRGRSNFSDCQYCDCAGSGIFTSARHRASAGPVDGNCRYCSNLGRIPLRLRAHRESCSPRRPISSPIILPASLLTPTLSWKSDDQRLREKILAREITVSRRRAAGMVPLISHPRGLQGSSPGRIRFTEMLWN